MTDDRLYELEVSVEVSTLYHEWRRSSLEFAALAVRAVALVGSILSLLFVFAVSEASIQLFVAIASGVVAVVTLIDLVFGVDQRARLHASLYQRFKKLQAEIARHRDEWKSHINEWAAEAQEIRVDEPPTLWVVYMRAWNQAIAKRGVDESNYRKVSLIQTLLGQFIPFRPHDFPLVR